MTTNITSPPAGGPDGQPGAHWRKSSRSGPNGGNCVEVAQLPDVVGVRDSKDPDGGHLAVDPDAWRSFTALVCSGQVDGR